MTALKTGALFAGYLGLEMGVSQVLDTELAWYSEIDKGALKILGHHVPDVPNLGDITAVDWTQVEPVDVLTGGSPCQDLSHAGKRAGMTEGTRSNLWVAMREAIAVMRPRYVIWENVRGAASAAADSAVEPCAGCVGDGPGVHLRALGRVVGDLAELGYVGRFHGLRAADVGAPHGRFRYFLVAADADGGFDFGGFARPDLRAVSSADGRRAADALLPSPRTSDTNGAGAHGSGGVDLRTAVTMLPTPRATDGTKGGPGQRGSSGDLMLPSAVALLPTPAVNDMGEGKTVEDWDAWTDAMKAKHGNGNGHGASLSIEAQRTRIIADSRASGAQRLDPGSVSRIAQWGQYADAIARWESLTRPAPAPTELGPKGSPRLSARFSEWMMGLPDGWITDIPGITRNEALKAAGNGVVPQQAAAALRLMLARASGHHSLCWRCRHAYKETR